MTFSLYSLFEAGLLLVNAVSVLHEERFLSKVGWGRDDQTTRGFGEDPGVKSQLINLIHSIRTVMRIPLILVNIMTILFKLILG
ncbi:immediate early response 3-interacting protein 1-like [Tachypleus tridentatus]|uniref:immediate early response 3-interacting protein 1-like n=1 Tax=Tachypleus tridentatus TaxID=6853 RepID=UPI003FD55D16